MNRLFLQILLAFALASVAPSRVLTQSNLAWTVVRGSDLEEGESQGLPAWSRPVGDPVLASNLARRVDFALFMVAALETDELIHEVPAIVGCQTPSALAHAADGVRAAGRRYLRRAGWR